MGPTQRKPGDPKSATLRDIPRACVDESAAVAFMERQRWGDTPICPHCDSTSVGMMHDKDGNRNKRYLWRCYSCRKQFTVRIGTILEDSRIPLRIWCHAFWRACSSKKGVSALQISRECSITYKSALFLMHRIRFAMTEPVPAQKLRGTVEVDETYVGGLPRNKGKNKRGRATKKTPVLAMIQRPGDVRVKVIPNVTAKTLSKEMVESISMTSRLCTDEFKSYKRIGRKFQGGHGMVMHSAKEYVRGTDHVNTAESFFSLVKRKFYGAHHAVSKKHLHRYIHESSFHWNTRDLDDGQRITRAIRGVYGKRLMYRQPVAKAQ